MNARWHARNIPRPALANVVGNAEIGNVLAEVIFSSQSCVAFTPFPDTAESSYRLRQFLHGFNLGTHPYHRMLLWPHNTK